MEKEIHRERLTYLKAFVCSFVAPLLAHILRKGLSEAVALGVGFFLAFILFYQLPPYIERRRPGLAKTIMWCAAGGLTAFLLTRFG